MKQAARRRPRTRGDADNAVGAAIAPASSPCPLVFLPAGAASRPSAELPLGQVTTHSLGALRRSLQEPAKLASPSARQSATRHRFEDVPQLLVTDFAALSKLALRKRAP